MNLNIIRAIIFLVAGLVLIFFPEKVMKMQDYFLKKIHVKQRDSKRATIILGIVFLAIAVILFVWSLIQGV